MSFSDWIQNHLVNGVRENGLRDGLDRATKEIFIGISRRVGEVTTYGDPYWESDWDVCILLDSCRHDLMQEVAMSWEFLPEEIPETWSPASMSGEWLERHVLPEYADLISETALISANPHTRHDWVANAGWKELDEVWRHSWDDDETTTLPRDVTDSAIWTWRNSDAKKMFVWYVQPHEPFVNAEWSTGLEEAAIELEEREHKTVWNRLRDGEISYERVWKAYRDNLNYVLDDVELLLENLDAEKVIITSDHGNAIGEWGVYGHPKYVPHPEIKRVPWVEVSAVDKETYQPDKPEEKEVSEDEVTSRLRDLGYLE